MGLNSIHWTLFGHLTPINVGWRVWLVPCGGHLDLGSTGHQGQVFFFFFEKLIKQKTIVNIVDKQGIWWDLIISVKDRDIFCGLNARIVTWTGAAQRSRVRAGDGMECLCRGCHTVPCPGWHLHGALIETTWSLERAWVWFRVKNKKNNLCLCWKK